MIGKCFFSICAVSAVCAVIKGNTAALSEAVFEGCAESIRLSLSLMGMMCLWCGVIEVFREAGAVKALAKFLSPVLKRIFPSSSDDSELMGDIASSVAANMLGVASAATPFALAAMEKLDEKNGRGDTACDDMVTLSVLGCSSISLFPTTVITLRHAAGSSAPYAILVPVWICSAACTATSLILARLTAKGDGKRRKRKEMQVDSYGDAVVAGHSRSPAVCRSAYGKEQERK